MNRPSSVNQEVAGSRPARGANLLRQPPARAQTSGTRVSILIEGGAHGLEQGSAVEGLAEKRDRAGLQGSPACLLLTVSRQDHYRNSRAHAREVSKELEPIHAGHPEVEHQTAC